MKYWNIKIIGLEKRNGAIVKILDTDNVSLSNYNA